MSAPAVMAARKYLSYFRIRFNTDIQYRVAAASGIVTQFFWGAFNILLYRAFYEGAPSAFPMGLAETTTYIWLRQAFLSLFNLYSFDESIFSDITSGNIAYELTKPVDIYSVWLSKTISTRLARATLRFAPILLIASFIPEPYGLSMPASPAAFLFFIITLILALLNVCVLHMIIYALTFYTMNPRGVRVIIISVGELLSGDLIPIPFFPEKLQSVLELTPFAAMSNIPFRIYSGNISGSDILSSLALQVIWLCAMLIFGRLIISRGLSRCVIQGG